MSDELAALPPIPEPPPLLPIAAIPSASNENPALTYLLRLSPSSQRVQKSALTTLAILLGMPPMPSVDADGKPCDVRWLHTPWQRLTPAIVSALYGRLQQPLTPDDDDAPAPAYANRLLTALGGVIRASWKIGSITADQRDRLLDWQPIKGSRLPPGRALDEEEQAALLRVCWHDTSLRGKRDRALIATLLGTGLRRQELVDLMLGSIVGQTIRVIGKGNKERTVPLPSGTRQALTPWQRIRAEALRTAGLPSTTGPLFIRMRKNEHPTIQPLTPAAIYLILQERSQAAGLEPVRPHDLRRTYVTMLLDAGVNESVVAHLVGHASTQTTARYDRSKDRVAAQVVERLVIPMF